MNVYNLDKFNTITLKISLFDYINKDDITKRSLLPYVLYEGSKNYQNQSIINKTADLLYGATISIGSANIGNLNELFISCSFVNPKFVNDEQYSILEVYKLLYDIIFNPKLENGLFLNETCNYQKEILRQEIISQEEHTMSFAISNALEEAYKGTVFSIRSNGYLEDIDKIDNKNLTDYYNKIIKENDILVSVTGDVDEKDLSFINISRNVGLNKTRLNKNSIDFKKEIILNKKVKQSCLIVLYKTNNYLDTSFYPSSLVYNYILGGSPCSFLFKELREKKGLCYSISSSYFNTNGLFLISMGIKASDYNLALKSLNEQIDYMKNKFDDEESLKDAKEAIIKRVILLEDKQTYFSNLLLSRNYFNDEIDQKKLIEDIKNVTLDDIKNIACMLEYKLTYFVKGEEDEDIKE